MKNRLGFVSNSSSSSFIIKLEDLTKAQLHCITTLDESGDESFNEDPWFISIEDDCVKGNTWMDNFSMRDFFEKIGVPDSRVEWRD